MTQAKPFSFLFMTLALLTLTSCTKPAESVLPLQLTPTSQEVLNSGYRRTTSIEEAENKHTVLDKRLGETPVVFGFMHQEWVAFKSKLQPGDELIEFYTPPAFEEMMHGFRGYEIVRNGKVVQTLFVST